MISDSDTLTFLPLPPLSLLRPFRVSHLSLSLSRPLPLYPLGFGNEGDDEDGREPHVYAGPRRRSVTWWRWVRWVYLWVK